MKIHKLLSALLLMPFFTGCNPSNFNENENFIESFPESAAIQVTQLLQLNYGIPKQILSDSSRIYLINTSGKEYLEVYDKETLDLHTKLGDSGEGPEEFQNLSTFRQQFFQNGYIYEYLFDYIKNRISILKLNSKNLDEILGTSEKLPRDIDDTFRLVYYSDSLKIAVPNGNEEAFRFKIIKNGNLIPVGYLPKLPFEIHKNNFYPIYTNVSAAVNEEMGVFVATSNLLGQYDFFDFNGNWLYSSVIERNLALKKANNPEIIFTEPVTFYNTDIIAEEQFFYALFTPMTQGEGMSKTKMHVINWKGEAVKEYQLDRTVVSFTFDKVKNCFYGLSFSMDTGDKIDLVKWSL